MAGAGGGGARVQSWAIGLHSCISSSKKGAMGEKKTGGMQRDFRCGEKGNVESSHIRWL